jgi:hypothetical protein
MNRAERRRLERQKIKPQDIKAIEDAAGIRGVRYAVDSMFLVLATCLHDKWGWGHVRIKRLFDQMDNLFDSVDKDFVSIEDLKTILENEIGIELRPK